MSLDAKLIQLSAPIEVETFGEEGAKKPRFKGVAYSGGAVPRRLWDQSAIVIDVESFDLSAEGREVFILCDHDHEKKAGKATAKKSGGKIVIENGTFFDNACGGEAESLMSQGAPYELSVGVQADVTLYEKGKRPKQMVNGVKHEIGAVLRNARLLEVSLVVAGADPKTSVTRMSAQHHLSSSMEQPMADEPKGDEAVGDTPPAPKPAESQMQAELTARNKELVAELTAEQINNRNLRSALAAKDEEIGKLQKEFAALRNKGRADKLAATFGEDIITAAEREKFFAMDEATFELMFSKLEALKPKVVRREGKLFAAHDAAKSDDKPQESILQASARRLGLVPNTKAA